MAMACRENGTSEEVNQLKEVIRQLRGAVFMLKDKMFLFYGYLRYVFVIFNESTNMHKKYMYPKKSFLLMSLKKCYAIIVLVGLKWIFCFYDLFSISIVFFPASVQKFLFMSKPLSFRE